MDVRACVMVPAMVTGSNANAQLPAEEVATKDANAMKRHQADTKNVTTQRQTDGTDNLIAQQWGALTSAPFSCPLKF